MCECELSVKGFFFSSVLLLCQGHLLKPLQYAIAIAYGFLCTIDGIQAAFSLHGSSDPIPIVFFFFFSHVAQIAYGPRPCKQEKVTWIPIFPDRFQASFICGNKSDTCICACRVSGQIGSSPIIVTPTSL